MQKVRHRRDSYLVDVILQAIEDGVSGVPFDHNTALNRGLQTIADLDALSASLQALDDFTYVAVRLVRGSRYLNVPSTISDYTVAHLHSTLQQNSMA